MRFSNLMKFYLVVLYSLILTAGYSQGFLPGNLQITESAPSDILSVRSVVLHDHSFTSKELDDVQAAFQKIGIDAIAYFETDMVLAGKDVTRAHAGYFTSRQIKYLLFLEKNSRGFSLTAVVFNQLPTLFDPAQPAWRESHDKLSEMLRKVFQDSWRNQKKQNYLVNEFPERDLKVSPFIGSRQEFYAIDLKVDELAVPKSGNEELDKAVEEFFKNNYPLKYKITEANADEQKLRSQGILYILCYVRTRGEAAREVLEYNITRTEKMYASITFPAGQLQLKTIPAETVVYKFYFRHISNGNVFLGTKWDADINYLDALRNHVLGFKTELKIN